MLRRASTAPAYREALNFAAGQLQKPEAQSELRMTEDERKLLREQYGLTDAELEEVAAPVFRPLDAHHLALCLELRDAARFLEQPGVAPLEQAELAFAWVNRRVLLRERTGEWTPPQFVLRRGQGSSLERALLFLALLQQLRIDGCLVALPGLDRDQPQHLVAGVISGAKDSKRTVHLFDPRRGLPLPSSDGRGPATLEQVRAQPALLLPPGVKDEKLGKPEVLLAVPLTALAPRMRYLEKLLANYDRVFLAIEPAAKLKELERAVGQPVRVWNSRPEGKGPAPLSPLRTLRAFLPPEEGGVDRTGRHQTFQLSMLSWTLALQKYREMRLFEELAAPARTMLWKFTGEMFHKFALAPREALQRGRYHETKKRLDRIRTVIDELEFAPLAESELQRRAAEWRQRANEVHLADIRGEPGAKGRVNALWSEDQFLVSLLNSPDEPDERRLPKKLLTYIVLTAAKESLGQEANYLLAMSWQEEAAHDQAAEARHGEAGNTVGERRAGQDARAAWTNARGWWVRFSDRYPLNSSMLSARLYQIRDVWQGGDRANGLALWEQLLSDLRTTRSARLFHARSLEMSGDVKQAVAVLETLIREIDALEEHGDLKKGLATCLEESRFDRAVQTSMRGIAEELGEGGTFSWLRVTARERLRQLTAK